MDEINSAKEVLDFLNKFSLFGIPGLVLVIFIVQGFKWLGLPGKYAPYAALLVGFVVALAIFLIDWVPGSEPIVKFVFAALLLGLASIGLHAGFKAVVMRFQQVPPGTVIKTPTGQTDTTPTDTFTEGKRGKKKTGEV